MGRLLRLLSRALLGPDGSHIGLPALHDLRRGVAFDARSDDGDADLVPGILVGGAPDDDVGIGFAERVIDVGGRVVEFFKEQIFVGRDVDEHRLGPGNGHIFQQRAGDGLARGFDGAPFAHGDAGAHHGQTGYAHDSAHVGEVHVDEAGNGDKVGNTPNSPVQHVVGAFQHIAEFRFLGRNGKQSVVRDGDQAVHVLAELGDALLRGAGAFRALKQERFGHDAHRQGSQFAGGLCHDGGRAGPGAAAHARGHEDHVGIADGVLDRTDTFLRRIAAHVGIGPGSKPFGQLLADLELDFSLGAKQSLRIRIGADEGDTLQARHDHVLHGIAAATADTDDLYIRGGCIRFKLHIHHSSSSKRTTC